MKKKRKTIPRDSRTAYIRRRSQITKKPPRKRLKKRRAKNFDAPRKGRFPNPRPLLFILTAKRGAGKKMHFDGKHFSERTRVKLFATAEAANKVGLALLRKFSILRGYKLKVEPNF